MDDLPIGLAHPPAPAGTGLAHSPPAPTDLPGLGKGRVRLPDPIGIYAILDAGTVDPASIPETARGIAAAGVRVFQVRAKAWSSGALADLCAVVRRTLPPACRVLVNDRADVALAVGADGVHVGDEDLPPSEARRVVGAGRVVGFSTHSIEEVRVVDPSVCDYVGFGPVFPSTTKATGLRPHGIEGLAAACRAARVPVVAIGGIRIEDLPAIRGAGASGAALISGLLAAGDPREAARRAVEAWEGRVGRGVSSARRSGGPT